MNSLNLDLIQREMSRAADCLRAARNLEADGLPADAISRAYYCVFHSAKALLYTRGIVERSHKGVVSRFGEYFVKTGLVEKHYGQILQRGKEERELSDYEVTTSFDEDRVSLRIQEAAAFLDMAQKFLARPEQ